LRLFARWLLLFALSVPACILNARAAGSPLWALLAEARVAGESIYLSDLLPARTPTAILDAAGKISLGAAPPPGGTITLSGDKIAGFLPTAARSEIIVPPQVVIHRSGRMLTRDEVVAALRSALQSNKLPGASGMEAEDIHFSAPVQVSATDARLEVRRIDFDSGLKQARFLLASAADRRALPFLVTANLRPPSPDNPSHITETPSTASDLLTALRSAESAKFSAGMVALVEPKKIAKLHVCSGTMQMFLDVVPLERGALHETVRVKIVGNGKILRGQVMAPGQLEAQF
jgi:hypothetical protein